MMLKMLVNVNFTKSQYLFEETDLKFPISNMLAKYSKCLRLEATYLLKNAYDINFVSSFSYRLERYIRMIIDQRFENIPFDLYIR